MSKIVLSGNMIELDINEIDSHLTEDLDDSVMDEAVSDMEEEFDEIVEFNDFF